MYILYHFPICPFSRKVRIVASEKKILLHLEQEKFWERSDRLITLNPAIQVPVLYDQRTRKSISDSNAICEYFDEISAENKLLFGTPEQKAEIRRLVSWFDHKFFAEVSKYTIYEKIIKYYMGKKSPNPEYIRAAKMNISYHLDYMTYLLSNRNWLAGNNFSLADITAAAQISSLDYLGDIDWQKAPEVKRWYSLIKSRPSFASILSDKIIGFNPDINYSNLDF